MVESAAAGEGGAPADFPEELSCPLCRWLLEDAVMLPCCAASVCESCARERLAESGNKCPLKECGASDTSQDDLIPNRRLRSKAGDYREKHAVGPRPREATPTPPPPEIEDIDLGPPGEDNKPDGDPWEGAGGGDPGTDTMDVPIAEADEKAASPKAADEDHLEAPAEKPEEKEAAGGNGEVEKKAEEEAPQPEGEREESNRIDVLDSSTRPPGEEVSPSEVHLRVSIPSELMDVAKDDPLSAFEKLMQVLTRMGSLTPENRS